MRTIKYYKRNKYEIAEKFEIDLRQLGVDLQGLNDVFVDAPYVSLKGGLLSIQEGFFSDGPSGPTVDTPSFMRAAFVHDALYYLARRDLLTGDWRRPADFILEAIAAEDKMAWWRRAYVWLGVRVGGRSAWSKPAVPQDKTYSAPN